MATILSVNVNKFATLRNSRGGNNPDVLAVVKDLVSWGVKGITVHPRPDERHIRGSDVLAIHEFLKTRTHVEFNIEGYPSEEFLGMIQRVRPAQCTMVPDPPDVLTSNAGWKLKANSEFLKSVCARLREWNVRSSLFVDPRQFDADELAALEFIQADRIELYTEAFALAYQSKSELESVVAEYRRVAEAVCGISVGVNAGHDLDTENLGYLVGHIPQILEVSIGHALVCEALFIGLKPTVEKYHHILGY